MSPCYIFSENYQEKHYLYILSRYGKTNKKDVNILFNIVLTIFSKQCLHAHIIHTFVHHSHLHTGETPSLITHLTHKDTNVSWRHLSTRIKSYITSQTHNIYLPLFTLLTYSNKCIETDPHTIKSNTLLRIHLKK